MKNFLEQVDDIFSNVRWMQRLNMEGRVAPEEPCDRATEEQEVSIAYSADYYSYEPSPE